MASLETLSTQFVVFALNTYILDSAIKIYVELVSQICCDDTETSLRTRLRIIAAI